MGWIIVGGAMWLVAIVWAKDLMNSPDINCRTGKKLNRSSRILAIALGLTGGAIMLWGVFQDDSVQIIISALLDR